MHEDGRLEEILDRWHERFEHGEDLSAAELCRDYPHLCDLVEERLAVLRHLARLGQRFDGDPAKREPITLAEETPWDDLPGPTVPTTPVPRRFSRRPMAVPTIPGYQVVEELGRGSMGVVFKAIHLPLKRTVALKVILNDDQATDDQRERFRTEAEAIARLQHPGIVQLFELGEYDAPSGRRAYMSMEYCNGDTLAKLLAEKPLPPPTAALVVESIARAVHAAHEAKVLHRDLKPGNVLLQMQMQKSECRMQNERQEGGDKGNGDGRATTRVDGAKRTGAVEVSEGGGTDDSSHSAFCILHSAFSEAFCILHSAFAVKVSDFGLAKKLDEDGQTNTGTVMGTPSYMAPEQAEGRRDLGPACDIYALGAILYECLTGRPPFKAATTYETIRQVIGSDPVPPRDLEANCPLDLDTICLKCLHKDPAKRYPTAAALAADLRRFRAGEPIHARPIGAIERLVRWGRRRPSEAALLAVLALVLLTVPPLMVWWHDRARQAEAEVAALEQTEALALKAAEEARRAAEASREGELAQQYHSLVHAARQRIAERPPEWPWLALADLRRAAALDTTSRNPVELRTAAVTATAGIDLRERARWTTHLGTGLPAFSPDSKTLGVAQFKTITHLLGTVGFFDVATGKVMRRVTFSAPSFYHRESQNRLVQETFSAPVFTADGQFAFVGCRSGKVVRFDLRPGGDKPLLWQADTGNLQKLLISGDGKSLYTFSRDLAGDQVIRRWTELLSARPVAAATSARGHVGDLVWSNAGTLLRRDGGQVDELDATTLQVRKAGQPFPAGVSGAVLAVLGPAEVLATAERGPIKLWDLRCRLPAGELLREEDDADSTVIDLLEPHPSGQLLASVDHNGTLALWNVATGRLLTSRHVGAARGIAFSPDGRWLAVSEHDLTRLFEVVRPPEQTWVGVQGLPIRAIATAGDRLLTVAARSGENATKYEVVLSEVAADGIRRVLSRRDATRQTHSFAVSPAPGRRTLLLGGDDRLTLLDRRRKEQMVYSLKPRRADVAVRPAADDTFWLADGDTIAQYRAGEAAPVRQWDHPDPFRGLSGYVCLDVGQVRLAAGGRDGAVLLLSTATADLKRSWQAAAAVRAVALSRDERFVVAGLNSGQVVVYRDDRSEPVATHALHNGRVASLAFSPDGTLLASGGRGGVVWLSRWQAGKLEPLCTLTIPQSRPVRQVLFSPDGGRLYVLGERETAVQCWDLARLRARLGELALGL